MNIRRRLLYIGSGILVIVGVVQLGAQTARSQSSGRLVVGGVLQSVASGVDQSGMIWAMGGSTNGRGGPVAPPRPGSIVATDANFGSGPTDVLLFVLYEDGDFYWYQGGNWTLAGNMFGGATPAVRTTWGRLKDEMR
jgi:hypothetical protein